MSVATKKKKLTGLNATIVQLMEQENGDILKVNERLKTTHNACFSENALKHRIEMLSR